MIESDKRIIDVACQVCNLDPEHVMSRKTRRMEDVAARIIIAYHLRSYGYPMETIARMMGYKCHGSVLHVLNLYEQRESLDPYTKSRIKAAEEILNGES